MSTIMMSSSGSDHLHINSSLVVSPTATTSSSNKRRCSDTALPGEHDQRRRQRLPTTELIVTAPSPSPGENSSDGEVQKKERRNVYSWSSTSSGFSMSTLSTVATPITTISHAGMFPMTTDQPLPVDLDYDDEDDHHNHHHDNDNNNNKDEEEEDEQQIHQRQWRRRVSRALCRSASKGNVVNVQQILTDIRLRPFLDVDAPDDEQDGITPLIYAACFGKAEVVQVLLDAGADSNVQDKRGWTALMWAASNNHSNVVQMLLAHGASSSTQSACGRTVVDYIDTQNEQMKTIFSPNHTTHHESACSSVLKIPSSPKAQSTTSEQQQKEHPPNKASSDPEDTLASSDDGDNDDDLEQCEASLQSIHQFQWDKCLPDQMFVFSEEDTEHILETAITRLRLPMETQHEIWVPANIIFLSARFAHYYSSRDLLHRLLHTAVEKIEHVLKQNRRDIHTLAFWMTNLSQLLYYLKKDTGLVVATAEYQLTISELICETYNLLVLDSEQRIDQILEPAMLDHEPLECLTENVHFSDDWQRFFRRGRSIHRRSVIEAAASPPPQTPSCTMSPQTIISLLSSILYVLQSYEVHPAIIIQATAQFLHFLSCELFNRILGNKKYLCRSKALQIRMNLTALEEWMRDDEKRQLPLSHLTSSFEPLVQLLQLLQCISQLNELTVFTNTIQTFELLNPLQIKRCVVHYRYEVSETRLSDQVEKYAIQMANDSIRRRPSTTCEPKKNNSTTTTTTTTLSITTTAESADIKSRHSQDDYPMSPLSPSMPGESIDDCSQEWIKEKRDSRYMLPFYLPNNRGWSKKNPALSSCCWDDQASPAQENQSLADAICQKLREERKKNGNERDTIPTIPEEWMDRLDCRLIS